VNNTVKHLFAILALATFMAAALLVSGCAAKQPIIERQLAEEAFANAIAAKKCAWARYQTAEQKLNMAHDYDMRKEYEKARDFYVVAKRLSDDAYFAAKENKECMDELEVKSSESGENKGEYQNADEALSVLPKNDPKREEYELKRIHFDFDSSEIAPDQQDVLKKHAEWLSNFPAYKVRLEGHADERGTGEYNLSLGELRCFAVRKFLIALGVGEDRFDMMSYGDEMPLVEGHDEEAWRNNRRVEFTKIAP